MKQNVPLTPLVRVLLFCIVHRRIVARLRVRIFTAPRLCDSAFAPILSNIVKKKSVYPGELVSAIGITISIAGIQLVVQYAI